MPSSATITAFYSFSAQTVISSSQMNTNFSNFRGHIIPISPNTATAGTTRTYDLGSTEYFWRNVYGQDIVLYGETAPSAPPSGSYKIYVKSADGTAYIQNSSGVESALGSGGGGGISLNWIQTGGNSPLQDVYSNDTVYLFDASLTQELFTSFRIPDSYQTGNQLFLKIVYTSTSTSSTVLFSSQSTLIKKDTTAFTSTTNQRTSTNVAVSLSASTPNRVNQVSLDLSDSSGLINSVTCTAGDTIKLRIYRGTDTDTSQVRLHTNQYEVTLT